jgi:hypothetical protein
MANGDRHPRGIELSHDYIDVFIMKTMGRKKRNEHNASNILKLKIINYKQTHNDGNEHPILRLTQETHELLHSLSFFELIKNISFSKTKIPLQSKSGGRCF